MDEVADSRSHVGVLGSLVGRGASSGATGLVLTDPELVAAVLAGDRSAFATLVERYERSVRGVAVSVVGDHHGAQDVAQEAFVVAYRHLASLRDSEAFGSWVLRIARREAVRWARRQRRVRVDSISDESVTTDDDGRLDEQSSALLAAVTKLPRHERWVVMLKHFDGHDVRTIAEMTGRPVGTVTKQLSRAYARLRERLKDVDG